MHVVNTQAILLPTSPISILNVTLLAVLTMGTAGDYAVYIGAAHLPIVDDMDPDRYTRVRDDAANWIAHSGIKQTYRKAIQYFPGLKESEYRA